MNKPSVGKYVLKQHINPTLDEIFEGILLIYVHQHKQLSIVIPSNVSYFTSLYIISSSKYQNQTQDTTYLSRWTHYHWLWFHSIYNNIITSTPFL